MTDSLARELGSLTEAETGPLSPQLRSTPHATISWPVATCTLPVAVACGIWGFMVFSQFLHGSTTIADNLAAALATSATMTFASLALALLVRKPTARGASLSIAVATALLLGSWMALR